MRFFLPLISLIFLVNATFCRFDNIFQGYDGKVTLYLLSASSNCQILEVDKNDVKNYKDQIKGLSLVGLDSSFVEDKIERFDLEKVFEEVGENFSSVYYYSPKIPAYKLINGQKVNFHVAKINDELRIGVPLIFGSF